jgi:hypothetical protein
MRGFGLESRLGDQTVAISGFLLRAQGPVFFIVAWLQATSG